MKWNYYYIKFESGKTVFVRALNPENAKILAQAIMITNGLNKTIKSLIKTDLNDMMKADFCQI
jgi:hypothetical protein